MKKYTYAIINGYLFSYKQIEQNIEIPIIDDMTPEKDEHFEIELFDPTGGAKLGQINRTAVTITNDDGEI